MSRVLFLALTLLLAACERHATPSGWGRATSRDGTLALDLPPTYRREGVRDVWVSEPASGPRRRFGLLRRPTPMWDPGRPPGVPEPVGPWENDCGARARATDVGCIVERSRWDGQIEGRHFVIETGRLGGAPAPRVTVLALRADWLRALGDTVRMEGAASDSSGLGELRRIATTLGPAS